MSLSNPKLPSWEWRLPIVSAATATAITKSETPTAQKLSIVDTARTIGEGNYRPIDKPSEDHATRGSISFRGTETPPTQGEVQAHIMDSLSPKYRTKVVGYSLSQGQKLTPSAWMWKIELYFAISAGHT